jgi:hypothetical protein
MKKLFLILIALLSFNACQNDDSMNENSPISGEKSHNRFYGVKYPQNQTKGVAVKNKLWYPDTPISIKFLDGTLDMQNKVKEYAGEWLQYAGISFNYVNSTEDADVSISFDMDDDRYVTWSYTGNNCLTVVDQSKATMNLAYWNYSTSTEQKGDVLRAFGQMLGLELEHRHLSLDPQWGVNVERYWTQDITDIPWATLKKYVMDPLSASNTLMTQEYDPNSIMIWPFTMRGVVTYNDGYEVPKDFNYELSEMDKEFISILYPKRDAEPILFFTVAKNSAYKSIHLNIDMREPITIDWGDGNTFTYNEKGIYNYTYSDNNSYDVNVYGDENALTVFRIQLVRLSKIDVSKLNNLEELYIPSGDITELNVSNNSKLNFLVCRGNKIASLDLINNSKLDHLDCGNNLMTSLDVSKNLYLRYFAAYDLNLSSIDISNNKNLQYFYLSNNSITSLDLSNNPNILYFDCNNTQLTTLDLRNQKYLGHLNTFDNSKLSELFPPKNGLLKTMTCSNNSINSLDLSDMPKLVQVKLSSNPIVLNRTELTNLVHSFPPNGTLIIYNENSASWIKDIASEKNLTVK